MWDVVTDSLLDTLKIFPFLFVLYIVIELLEHKTRMGKPFRALSGKAAPIAGAAVGLVPMCGFSVMSSKLYERRYLTLGTLVAVLISTSDEAILVLAVSSLSILDKVIAIALLCGCKFIAGLSMGYLVDFVLKKSKRLQHAENPENKPDYFAQSALEEHDYIHDHDHEECGKQEEDVHGGHDHDHEHDHGHCHGHDGDEELHACEHKSHGAVQLYLVSPLFHALKIAAVILAFNLVFGFLIYAIGEDTVVGFLQGAGLWYQPLVCCLVGLIPNCASSVVLAETYAMGGIAFGSLLGGLMTNAGLGVLILFRNKAVFKRNIAILVLLFVAGIAWAYLVNLITFALF